MTLIRSTVATRRQPAFSRTAGASHMGMCRERNEDSYLLNDVLGFYAVADGVGGRAAGDVASVTAVSAALGYMAQRLPVLEQLAVSNGSVELLERLAATALRTAETEVAAASRAFDGFRGMCTTLTLLVKSGRRMVVSHAGDSRAYKVRRDGSIEQLTRDDNLAADLEREGLIDIDDVGYDRCAATLTQCLGGRGPAAEPQVISGELAPGEFVVLCTDGLTGYVDDDEIAQLVQTFPPRQAVRMLIQRANQRGGGDNITAVVVEG